MADYTERFWDAATALGLRFFEESGARDVWDELANFNDEDMSVSDWLKNAGSVAWQMSNAPLNTAASLSIEANRALGAVVLAEKPGNWGNAWNNYATAWTPPTPSETEQPEGEEFAPGIYTAATAGDLLVVANDRLVANLPGSKFVNRRLVSTLGFPLGGAGYVLGTMGQPEGPYRNGSYVSPAFDITSYDAGEQIRNSYLRTVQTIGNVSLEAVIDPLNWASGPIGAGIAGLSAKRLVTVPGAPVPESLTTYTDLIAAARTNRTLLRNSQRPPGIGMWSQQRLFEAMSQPGMKDVVRRLVENKDAQWATDFFLRNNMAQGEAASELGKLSAFINDEKGMWDLFNAAAYRNVESVNNLKRIVIDNTPLSNSLDTTLGTGDNLFDQALVDFPIGSALPDGHILEVDAQKFLENALNENPTARAAWDKFAEEAGEEAAKAQVAAFKEAATARKGAIEVMQKMFPEGQQRADQMLMQVPTARMAERALRKADPEWLAYGKTSAVRLPGGSHRFSPKFLLLSRPGLTFKLHGTDAITKFDDMIRYANGLIGSTLKNADGTPYQFALDPETLKIRAAFLDAGTDRLNPEQLRASIVNTLQKHVLTKIAEDAGFDYEVAAHLAESGMVRADNLNSALLSANKGYMSTVNEENGVITVLANHPTTGRQAANFVPIMDWAGVRRAMHSRPMRALTNPDEIASVVKQDDPGLRALLGRYPVESRNDLKKFGRVETPLGALYHGLVDISDTVRQVFTHSVLLRLGYPVRNLAEGTLSTTGSGVGLINVLSKMDFASLFSNHFSNVMTMLPRQADRMKSYFGIINNERALEATLRQINHSIGISSDSIARMLYLVTEPTTIDRLEEIITTSTKPELVAEAEKSLRYLTEMKFRLAKGLDEEFVVTDEMKELTGVAQRLYHTDLNDSLAYAQDEMDETILRLDGKLDRPLSTSPQSTIAQMHVDAAYSKGMFGEPVPGAPQWATRRFGAEENSAPAQWAEAKKRMVELRKTHKIEYRMSPDDNWAPYTHYTKYVEGVTDKFEFRAIPREGKEPRVLAIDTWGKELDFRQPVDLEAKGITNFDQDVLNAAVTGDRAAQERMSEILADHGIYRTVWNDSEDWGEVNVLIHPKAIGNRGLAHAVDSDIRARVAERAAKAGPDMSAIPKPSAVANKRLPGQMLGKPIDPTYHGKLSKVLENGGFEKIMDDAIAERVKLIRQKAALQTALDQRKARVAQVSKKRGRATPNLITKSRYAPDGHYVNANMLAGHNGYAYANYASADETTSVTISGNLYRQDLLNDLRRSFMQPKDMFPDDPMYWDGFANLLGRMYRDLPGAEDMAAIGVKSMDDIDPIVRMALQPGDRERLYEDAVDWALHTTEGRDWVKTLDLATPPTGTTGEAIELGAKEAAYRGTPKAKGRAGRRNTMNRQDWRESQGGAFGGSNAAAGELQRIEVADVIAAQFNFVDNYMLDNPEVARLFLEGKATAENLRKAYEANPWELKPFNGLLSPTSAEYKQARLAAYEERGTARELTNRLLDSMSTALRAIGSQPETRMLRHPVFETVANLDFQQRVTHAENTLGRALSLAEQADLRSRSQAFALTKIKDTLYTLESRSTLDDYLRFVAPFFPAWVNAASRWGKFYLRNPANPGKIASRITSIANNTVLVDENGEPVEADGTAAFDSYLVVPFGAGNLPFKPLSDLVNKMWPGAAEVMNKTYIPLRSIDVIFQGQPGNPGFGPWVTVPTQYLLNKRDDWFQNEMGKWIIKQVMPVGPTASGVPALDYVQHFLPTGVRRIIDNALKDKAWYSQYSKNKLTLISMQADGEWEGTPEQMEEDAMELTRFSTWVRIASAFVSPVAQQQRGEPEFYASRWREFRDETGSADEADRKFYELYPTKWVLSQGMTSNLTGGMANSVTTANQRSTEDLARVAAQLDAPELLGFSDNYQPDGELPTFTTEDYNPYSRRWQMYNNPAGFSENYRGSKSVEEVAREAAVDEGWMMYQQVEAAVSGRLVAQGYKVNSYEFQKAKQERMSAAAVKLAQDYPQWGLARGEMNTAKNERNAIYFKYTLNNKDWMAGKEEHLLTQSMREYLIARDVARAGMEKQGDAKSSTAKANQQWNAALAWKREQLSQQSPAFKEWVDRYFRNDIVSTDDITLMEGAA